MIFLLLLPLALALKTLYIFKRDLRSTLLFFFFGRKLNKFLLDQLARVIEIAFNFIAGRLGHFISCKISLPLNPFLLLRNLLTSFKTNPLTPFGSPLQSLPKTFLRVLPTKKSRRSRHHGPSTVPEFPVDIVIDVGLDGGVEGSTEY